MKLVDVLLHNWFLIVIAYFFISTVIKTVKPRSRQDAPQAGKPTRGMPPFGGGPGWPGRSAEPSMTKAGPRPAGASKPALERSAPSVTGRQAPTVNAPAPAPAAPEKERAAAVRTKRSAAADASSSGLLSPQDAARGVLWAEILGPPRAKRPYIRK